MKINERQILYFFIFIALIFEWRLYILFSNTIPLQGDEAQYWKWSTNFAWGYFSKPPLLAWIIALTTKMFSSVEAYAIRFASNFAYFLSLFPVFLLARQLYNVNVASWSIVVYFTLPAIFLSSQLISTDPFLLFFWCWSLYFFWNAWKKGGYFWWAALGVSLGFGFLSKYATLFFLPSMIAWLVIHKEKRKGCVALTAGLAALFLLPNLYWNFTHKFVTFSHTAANISGSGLSLNWHNLGKFVGSQFAVFGPILFSLLLFLLVFKGRSLHSKQKDKFLLYFTVPLLIIMCFESLFSRAHANWAAPAYVAGTLLLVSRFIDYKKILIASTALHVLVAGYLYHYPLVTSKLPFLEIKSFSPIIKLKEGEALSEKVAEEASKHRVNVVLSDHRVTMALLMYYLRTSPLKIMKWRITDHIGDYYDMISDLSSIVGSDVLFVTKDSGERRFEPYFTNIKRLDNITFRNGKKIKEYYLFLLKGYQGGKDNHGNTSHHKPDRNTS